MIDPGLGILFIMAATLFLAGFINWVAKRTRRGEGIRNLYGEMDETRWIAITAIMTALVLVGNYVLVVIPNVELGTVFIFLTGSLFGFYMGAWCVLLSSIIYGIINPWGALIPQILITQILGWFLVAFAGGLIAKSTRERGTGEDILLHGFIGLLLTLLFDLLTNFGFAWAFEIPYPIALLSGLPFMAVHIVSNAFIFAALGPSTSHVIREQLGSQIWQRNPENMSSLGEEY